jgi:hypothetical protein
MTEPHPLDIPRVSQLSPAQRVAAGSASHLSPCQHSAVSLAKPSGSTVHQSRQRRPQRRPKVKLKSTLLRSSVGRSAMENPDIVLRYLHDMTARLTGSLIRYAT